MAMTTSNSTKVKPLRAIEHLRKRRDSMKPKG